MCSKIVLYASFESSYFLSFISSLFKASGNDSIPIIIIWVVFLAAKMLDSQSSQSRFKLIACIPTSHSQILPDDYSFGILYIQGSIFEYPYCKLCADVLFKRPFHDFPRIQNFDKKLDRAILHFQHGCWLCPSSFPID